MDDTELTQLILERYYLLSLSLLLSLLSSAFSFLSLLSLLLSRGLPPLSLLCANYNFLDTSSPLLLLLLLLLANLTLPSMRRLQLSGSQEEEEGRDPLSVVPELGPGSLIDVIERHGMHLCIPFFYFICINKILFEKQEGSKQKKRSKWSFRKIVCMKEEREKRRKREGEEEKTKTGERN
jgi:hypothetical protein